MSNQVTTVHYFYEADLTLEIMASVLHETTVNLFAASLSVRKIFRIHDSNRYPAVTLREGEIWL